MEFFVTRTIPTNKCFLSEEHIQHLKELTLIRRGMGLVRPHENHGDYG